VGRSELVVAQGRRRTALRPRRTDDRPRRRHGSQALRRRTLRRSRRGQSRPEPGELGRCRLVLVDAAAGLRAPALLARLLRRWIGRRREALRFGATEWRRPASALGTAPPGHPW
jgi:hypothetical protein